MELDAYIHVSQNALLLHTGIFAETNLTCIIDKIKQYTILSVVERYIT